MQYTRADLRPKAGIVWSLGGTSAALILAGAFLGAQALAPLGPNGTGGTLSTASAQSREPLLTRKSPEAFGLPAYPGAFGFFSSEAGSGRGSASYSVKKGSAEEITRFYQRAFIPKGWQVASQRTEIHRPGRTKNSPGRAVKGLRTRWVHPYSGQQMQLLALDFPQNGSTAQVVLGWSPVKDGSSGAP